MAVVGLLLSEQAEAEAEAAVMPLSQVEPLQVPAQSDRAVVQVEQAVPLLEVVAAWEALSVSFLL